MLEARRGAQTKRHADSAEVIQPGAVGLAPGPASDTGAPTAPSLHPYLAKPAKVAAGGISVKERTRDGRQQGMFCSQLMSHHWLGDRSLLGSCETRGALTWNRCARIEVGAGAFHTVSTDLSKLTWDSAPLLQQAHPELVNGMYTRFFVGVG